MLLYSRAKDVIPVGRLGELRLERGYYMYVGSAWARFQPTIDAES
ncbi:hypothetical protein ACFL6M_00485 [Candidatus Eisenbacteria bacterium]|uniref:Uncharacterized protein n=1 Tax=Eiseniibacteriota bacterium TaxID=2212470 RepID=A0ABV6YI93_UNCEI